MYFAKSVPQKGQRKPLRPSSAGMYILHNVQKGGKKEIPPVANGRMESHDGSTVIPEY